MPSTEGLQPASRFRVEIRNNVTLLVTGTERRMEFPLRQAGMFLNLSGHVTYAGRSVSPNAVGHSRWLIFDRPRISIGAAGDEGFSSPLADDSIFVVDGAQLRAIKLWTFRVVGLSDLEGDENLELLVQEGKAEVTSPLDSPRVESAIDQNDRESFGRGRLAHVSARAKLWDESVEVTIGIPDAQYSDLFDCCVARRVDQISFGCILLAHTAAGAYETPRDLVVFSDQSIPIRVTDVTVGCAFDSFSGRAPNNLDHDLDRPEAELEE